MPSQDEWSHDPSVQIMRQIFSRMEKAQEELLRDLNISPLDPRLREGRKHARDLFERLWPRGAKKRIIADEKEAALLYIHCLAHGLSQEGIDVGSRILVKDEKIVRLLEEEG